MPVPLERILALVNAALAKARTTDGLRLSLELAALGEWHVSFTMMLFDASNVVTDAIIMEGGAVRLAENASEARVVAFAEGLERAAHALDWELVRSSHFPPWVLLDVAS